MVPLNVTIHPYGKVSAILNEGGERYYMLIDKQRDVALMPADVIEPLYAGSVSARVEARLRVPCTCEELAVSFDITLPVMRAYLYQLRKQGRVVRLDKRVPRQGRGPKGEYLWRAA